MDTTNQPKGGNPGTANKATATASAALVFRLPGTTRARRAYKAIRANTTAEATECLNAVERLEAIDGNGLAVFSALAALGVDPERCSRFARRLGYMRSNPSGRSINPSWDSAS